MKVLRNNKINNRKPVNDRNHISFLFYSRILKKIVKILHILDQYYNFYIKKN